VPAIEVSSGPPRLLVVSLPSGRIRTWRGLAGTGAMDSIEDPVWTTSASLAFLVRTCHASRAWPYNATCEDRRGSSFRPPASTEWTLGIPAGSAPLGSGRVLLRLPGATVQSQSAPRADSVTALQLLNSGGIRVARYAVPTGRLLQVLYRGRGARSSNYRYAGLAADGSGKYLLVTEDVGAFFGWIDGGGQFHKLRIHARYGDNEVMAATW
jgi:hypothetical protein